MGQVKPHIIMSYAVQVLLAIRPYRFDFMLLGQKWLANEIGRSV